MEPQSNSEVRKEWDENAWDQGDVIFDNQMEDLMNQLPSQQIDAIADMAAKSLKRRKASGMFRGSLIKNKESLIEEEIIRSFEQDLSSGISNLDYYDSALKTLPTTLSNRKSIKQRLSAKKPKAIGRHRYFMYWFGMVWQHFKYNMKNAMGLFDLWRSHLVKIEGHFGTSVVSYFIFLKWVLLINIPLFFVTFALLVFPQILFRLTQRDPLGYKDSEPFHGIELLTGGGFFENTEMYYGFYTNETVEAISYSKYKMKYAYLFTCAGYYLFCLIILAYSFLKSYQKYYIESSGALSLYYFNLVLCGWDYSITNRETANLEKKSLSNELKEYLSGNILDRDKYKTVETKKVVWLKRVCVWFVIIVLLAGVAFATHYISVELTLTTALANQTSIPVISPLAMPVIISSMHLIIPMIFTFLESFEEYSQQKYQLYIHMFRDMALKSTILVVLVVFWFGTAAKELECSETFVGQEIYRLVIVDLIFTVGYSFFMEFIRRLFSKKFKAIQRSEFAVGRHTLELIYSQSLCWLGVYYCPVIPFITTVKLIIIFYCKRLSVVSNCQSSLKPWRASNTHTVFVGYLFGFFILCLVHFGYGVFLMKPSTQCGPYKNLDSTFDVVRKLVDEWKNEDAFLHDFFDFISSPGFIAAMLVFFSVGLYYMRIIMLSHRSMVEQMKFQLLSEGKDKRFLMNLLNEVKEKGCRVRSHPGTLVIKAVTKAHSASPKAQGKLFVRSVAESILKE